MKNKIISLCSLIAAAFALATTAFADIIDVPPAPETTSPNTSGGTVLTLIVALVVIIAALVVIALVRRKARQK